MGVLSFAEQRYGQKYKIGTDLPPVRAFVRELLDDATGDPQLIWTDQSIRSSKDILCVSYLVIVPLIGGCIMAASQIVMRRVVPRSPTKPAKANKRKLPAHA